MNAIFFQSRLNYIKVKEIYDRLLSMTEVDPTLVNYN